MHPKDAPTAPTDVVLAHLLDAITAMGRGHFTARVPAGLPGLGGRVADALNAHLDMLQQFHREHLRLTEELGVTGRLGGHAEVPGAAGAWREMVDATNRMGFNLTRQVRLTAAAVDAIARGDATGPVICDDIGGEFRELTERVNAMAERTAGAPV